MARPTMNREELISRLAAVFREHGYEGASLARLAAATGLVKASLYYQFPRGKEDMAAAVLDALGEQLRRDVLEPLGEAAIPPRERLVRMTDGLDRFYRGGRDFCAIDVFGIGEAGRIFRRELEGAVGAVIAAVTGLLREAGLPAVEAGRRAEDALVAIQGSLVLARATGDPAPFRRVLRDLPDRLLDGRASLA